VDWQAACFPVYQPWVVLVAERLVLPVDWAVWEIFLVESLVEATVQAAVRVEHPSGLRPSPRRAALAVAEPEVSARSLQRHLGQEAQDNYRYSGDNLWL
jgi:hypothetical protein